MLARLALLASLIFAASAPSASASEYSAFVFDTGSGEVLHAQRADVSRAPASLTKLMTLYLTFEAIEAGELALGEQLTVSAAAAAQPPTRLGLREGDTIRTLEAMKALIVRSANDAAVVLAERVGGSEARFAHIMTERALELGLTRTRFTNASGLPDADQTSTARDVARLAEAVTRDYPTYYALFSLTRMQWRGETILSHNNIMHMVDGADGMKTGYTDAARYCLAASAERGDRRLIAVVMGAPNAASRDAYAARLLEAGFDALDARPPAPTLVSNQAQAGGRTERAAIRAPQASGRLLSIVVEEATPPAAPAPAVLHTRAQIITTDLAPARTMAGWSVQVGAYSSEAQAHARLESLAQRAGDALADGRPTVAKAPDASLWRARLAGFDRDSAEASCAALKHLGEACFVIAAN